MGKKKLTNRRLARETAFLFLFENSVNDYSLDEIIESKKMLSDGDFKEPEEFTREVFEGVKANQEKIDHFISKYSKLWNKNRISKVALTILRLSVFEILFRDDIPTSVSINEAVELAKKYGMEAEASFINGILGSISKETEKSVLSDLEQ